MLQSDQARSESSKSADDTNNIIVLKAVRPVSAQEDNI